MYLHTHYSYTVLYNTFLTYQAQAAGSNDNPSLKNHAKYTHTKKINT